jgi:ubiquinone/menaquinone biosynthesis C-methylase UbiE
MGTLDVTKKEASMSRRGLDADPKRIVAEGYDEIADKYAEFVARSRDDPRHRYTTLLLERLPPGSRVLELGCGRGEPTTRLLAERFAMTGVDLSARQIECARRQVPSATFMQADMTALDWPDDSFDAVVAFYSLTHVPRNEHRRLLQDVARWLRPGGLLVATMGAGSSTDAVEDDWLGAPMYFSHFGARTNRRLTQEAGFRIISARVETTDEDGDPVPFLWVVAEKPNPSG